MDALDSETSLFEFQHLIVHQCDEWTNHKSRPTSCQPWQLVAKGLARTCRHDEQCVFPRRDRLADGLLIRPERGKTKRIRQKLGQSREARQILEVWKIRRT